MGPFKQNEMSNMISDDSNTGRVLDKILTEFKGMTCVGCNRHIGYVFREGADNNEKFCSGDCLIKGAKYVQHKLGTTAKPFERPTEHCDLIQFTDRSQMNGILASEKLDQTKEAPVNEVNAATSNSAIPPAQPKFIKPETFLEPEVKVTTNPTTVPALRIISKPEFKPIQVAEKVPEVKPVKPLVSLLKSVPSPLKSEVKKIWSVRNANLSSKLINGASVRINFLWDLSKVTIMCVDDDDDLNNLQAKIESCSSKSPTGIKGRIPQLDEIVIAPYEDSLYRGKITSFEDGKVHVEFLDFGDKVIVELNQIREPTEEEMLSPIFGVVMKNEGVPNVTVFENKEIEDALEETYKLEIKSTKDGWTGILKRTDGNGSFSSLAMKVLASK